MRVVDGDTLVVASAAGAERVRVRGYDSPEVGRPGALPAPALMMAGDEHELFVLDSMGMIHQYRLEP